MKFTHTLFLVALVLFAGCAKNSDVAALQAQVTAYHEKTESLTAELEALEHKVRILEAESAERDSSVNALGSRVNDSNHDIFGLVRELQQRLSRAESRLSLNADMRTTTVQDLREAQVALAALERQLAHVKDWTLGSSALDWRQATSESSFAPWGIYLKQPLAERVQELENKTALIEARLHIAP